MQRLGITADSQQVISSFLRDKASAKQRARLKEAVKSIEDGTWCKRWWPCPGHPPDGDVCEIHPGEAMMIVFLKIVDEEVDPERELAKIIYIDTDFRYDEPECAY